MSLNTFSPMQLGDLAAVFSRLIISREMVSKRGVRAYVEEDDGVDDGATGQGMRSSTYEETRSIGMERQPSSSSSGRTSCEGSAVANHAETGGVDLGRDLTDILEPRALPNSFTTDTPTTSPARSPVNFGIVVPGVYRSSYPTSDDYAFIRDLKLKMIVTLVDKDYPEGYKSFMEGNGIRHRVFSMRGTKKEAIPVHVMKSILRLVLDRQNHPLLIHCNHGKHRTGCVVAVIRKLSGWTLPRIVDEYTSYAFPKARGCDVEYITRFQLSSLSNLFKDATAVGFRVPNFFRSTFFTICVLAIWVISGSQMAYPATSPARRREDASD